MENISRLLEKAGRNGSIVSFRVVKIEGPQWRCQVQTVHTGTYAVYAATPDEAAGKMLKHLADRIEQIGKEWT